MDFQGFMAIFSGLLGGLGTAMSVWTLKNKSKAEREYLRVLRRHAENLKLMRTSAMGDGVVTEDELAQLIASLDRASECLSSQDRKLVATGLHQPSIRGRARYAAKLLNKAGIGSGSLPVAFP